MASQGETSMSLVRKRTDTDLMPPPPLTKKIKRPKKVIDEDAYTEALSKIIARDFFPGLLESETQQEYLDALDSKDSAWISSAGRRLQQVMTPGRQRPRRTPSVQPGGQTPVGYGGDTPATTISTVSVVEERVEIDTSMSLAAFQAKYTSEDNESFYKLLDKQNQKRADKYGWLWRGNKLPSKQELKQKEIEERRAHARTLPNDIAEPNQLAILNADNRPAAPETWVADPKNALMFSPDGVEDALETIAQRAQAESRAAPKSIVYENTRMPVPDKKPEASVPPSPSLSAVRDAIAGRSRPGYQDSTTGGGNETPRVNGYAFVDDEEPEEPSPAAPLIELGRGDATPNPFKLQESSKREELHRRMVERIAQSKRTSAKLGLTGKPDMTPVPKFPSSPRVTGGLTPAAQRLWSKIGSGGGTGSATPFDGRATPLRGKSSGLRTVTKRVS